MSCFSIRGSGLGARCKGVLQGENHPLEGKAVAYFLLVPEIMNFFCTWEFFLESGVIRNPISVMKDSGPKEQAVA
jgi:hypothetical protein